MKPARLSFWISAACAAALVAFAVPRPARADDAGEKAPPSPVEAQMRKIVQLMRENEEALLAASRGGGGKAKPVDVPAPPAGPDGAPPPAATGAEAPKPAGEKGDSAARGIDDLLAGAGARGATLRRELEELLRMIPT